MNNPIFSNGMTTKQIYFTRNGELFGFFHKFDT